MNKFAGAGYTTDDLVPSITAYGSGTDAVTAIFVGAAVRGGAASSGYTRGNLN